jgi:hypothetical protein
MLYSVRLETILEKSGLGEKLANKADTPRGVAGILKNKGSLGVDLDDLLFFFVEEPGSPFPRTGFVARVINRAKLVKTLGLLEEDGLLSVAKKDDYTLVLFDGPGLSVVFNDKVAVGMYDNGREGEFARELLVQPAENSILSNGPLVEAAFSGDEEFAGCFSFEAIYKYSPVGDINLPGMDAFSKLFGIVKIGFPDGAARLEARVLIDSIASTIGRPGRPATLSQLAYFPASPMFLATGTLNGEEYYKVVRTLFSFAPGLFLPSSGGRLSSSLDTFREVAGMLSSIDGDVTFGIIPGMPVPSLLLCAGAKDTRLLEVLNKYLSREYLPVSGRTELSPGSYRVDMAFPGLSLYYGVKDGLFTFTNDEKLFRNVGTPLADSYKSSSLARRIPRDACGYFLLDFPSVIQPLSLLAGMSGGGSIPPGVAEVLSRLRYLEGYVESDGGIVLQVEFTDPKTNALKLIGDAIDF